jgi:hypothetical protein
MRLFCLQVDEFGRSEPKEKIGDERMADQMGRLHSIAEERHQNPHRYDEQVSLENVFFAWLDE